MTELFELFPTISPEESEARWQSIVDNPIFGVSFIDREHRFIATNPTYQRMVGYTNDELRQLTPLDLSVPGEREVNAILFKELQEGKRQHFEMIKQLRRKDGGLVWVQLYVFAIRDAGTQTQLVFGIMQDITESKRTRDELEKMRAELARVARMTRMNAMTASIAHEINQPLGAIVMNASAAVRWLEAPEPNLAEVRAALDRIVLEGDRTAKVISSIRAMFGKHSSEHAPIDVEALIREVLALAQSELQSHHIAVDAEPLTVDVRITGDRVQLQQVMLNLVTNAIDAMSDMTTRERRLAIKAEAGEDNVEIVIEDAGTGIDPGHIKRIFDAFFTTKSHGLGLGLSICRSIVEAHGGRIWAVPRSPHGTAFHVRLPRADTVDAAPIAP